MEFRIEDAIEKAKKEDKYNSAVFIIRSKLEDNKEIRFKMLDAYYDMFRTEDGVSGFMRPDVLYRELGGMEIFYYQFEVEYIG